MSFDVEGMEILECCVPSSHSYRFVDETSCCLFDADDWRKREARCSY